MEAMLATDPALLHLASSTAYPDLRLLVLFGSRARDEAGADADWDFGYVATDDFRPDRLLIDLTLAVKSDRVEPRMEPGRCSLGGLDAPELRPRGAGLPAVS